MAHVHVTMQFSATDLLGLDATSSSVGTGYSATHSVISLIWLHSLCGVCGYQTSKWAGCTSLKVELCFLLTPLCLLT